MISVSDIPNYFTYIIRKHEAVNDNHSMLIYVNKIKNGITFRIKTGYYLVISTPESFKLLENTQSKVTKDKNGE